MDNKDLEIRFKVRCEATNSFLKIEKEIGKFFSEISLTCYLFFTKILHSSSSFIVELSYLIKPNYCMHCFIIHMEYNISKDSYLFNFKKH